ncbi:MAG: 30S ribosomal protein S2 [Candidatus Berkelbacteria bacterium]|nr:30S ribosomal protein S2 [Candidatus Berkelbacteria bacterium]
MESPTLREMLAAGVHFGHKRARWNPKMEEFIFATKNGVSIINLEKSKAMLEKALQAVTDEVKAGKNVVFVTSKRQAKEIVKEAAISCGMPYVVEKWRGGTLTNYEIVSKNFKTLKSLNDQIASPEFDKISNIEQNKIKEKAAKLERIFGGLADLKKRPDILFLIGAHDEQIALKEAKNQGIKVVALVDTNADPREIDWPVPANDDATKSIKLMVDTFAKAIAEVKPAKTEEVK